MNIDKYKSLLDAKSEPHMQNYTEQKSRYASFKQCLNYLKNIDNPSILELGTCRSFVDGAFEGCNSNDPKYWDPNDYSKWDFGAGCFSLIFGLEGYEITTVDIISDHINRCKLMTDSLQIKCNHIISDSLEFLKNTNKKYHLIYLDTGDVWPREPTATLQLKETQIIHNRGLLHKNGYILLDDVKNKTPFDLGEANYEFLAKSKYSIPYLLEKQYKLIFEGYQFIFEAL
jgi:hypothetical protein